MDCQSGGIQKKGMPPSDYQEDDDIMPDMPMGMGLPPVVPPPPSARKQPKKKDDDELWKKKN